MRLILQHFMCYEKKTIDFEKTGIYYLSGPSGSGKSSICKALLFLRYGQRGKFVQHGKKRCIVRIETNTFQIQRQKGPERVQVWEGDKELEGTDAETWLEKHFPIIFMDNDNGPKVSNTHFLKKTAAERWTYIQSLACPERWNEPAKAYVKRLLLNEEQQYKTLTLTIQRLKTVLKQQTFDEHPDKKLYDFYTKHIGLYTDTHLRDMERRWALLYEHERRKQYLQHSEDTIREQIHIHSQVQSMRKTPPPRLLPPFDSWESIEAMEHQLKTYQCPHCNMYMMIQDETVEKTTAPLLTDFRQHSIRDICHARQALSHYEKEQLEYEAYKHMCSITEPIHTLEYWRRQEQLLGDTEPIDPPMLSMDEIRQKLRYIDKRDELFYTPSLSDTKQMGDEKDTEITEDMLIEYKNMYRLWMECVELEKQMETSLSNQSLYRTFMQVLIDCESECIQVFLDTLNDKLQKILDTFFQGDMQSQWVVEQSKVQLQISFKNTPFELQELSTGEYARLSLAMTLVFVDIEKPIFLLLDECVSHLDQENALLVFESLNIMSEFQSIRIIVIAHQIVTGLFTHVIQLDTE